MGRWISNLGYVKFQWHCVGIQLTLEQDGFELFVHLHSDLFDTVQYC